MKLNARHDRVQKKLVVVAFLALLISYSPYFHGYAQESQEDAPPESGEVSRSEDAELAAIRAGSDAFVHAFNQGDAEAVAECWTEGGEYVDDVGRRFSGCDKIKQGYAEFFKRSPKVTLRLMIDSLRMLSDTTAIEDGRAIVDPPPAGVPGFSKYTAIHVKVDGKWLMASVRDTHIETPSAFRNIADLEWLIGTWTAAEHGNKVESVCTWTANKSFVRRHYTIMRHDGTETSGLQIIGWNAIDSHVQSWDFSPDGGHAIGIWSPHEGGWTAEVQGMTGDGIPTASVNSLTSLDNDTYVWQSMQRTADDVPLPDTGEVILKRQTSQSR